MTKKEALQILMLSPFYYRMSLGERKILVDEFYLISNEVINASKMVTEPQISVAS